MAILSVGILPWLDIREAIEVGNVTFYRADSVAEMLGESAPLLADRMRIYVDGQTGRQTQGTVAIHRDQVANGGPAPYAPIRRATDILMMAAIFNNDGELTGQNATTFELLFQKLGGGLGFLALHVRGRNWGMLTGATTEMRMTRPIHAGRFMSYNRMIRDALVAADMLGHDRTWKLFESIALFRRASTDADNVDEFVDLVLLLTAVDFLLLHPGTKGAAFDYTRVCALLTPFEKTECCCIRVKDVTIVRCHIETVMFALNADRNASLHPRDLPQLDGPFSFQLHRSPTFAWFVDRSYMAILVARLVELGVLPLSVEVQAIVAGTEQWIFNPEHPLRRTILAAKVRISLREAVRNGEGVEHAAAARADGGAAKADWERQFRIALGEVPDQIHAELSWLDDDRVMINVLGPAPERELIHSSVVQAVTDDPVMMAYATQPFFDNDQAIDEDEPMTARQLEAMHNPFLWINAEVHR